MAKKTYSVRLNAAKSEQVEKIAEEKGISESDAIRELIRDGIEFRRGFREFREQLIDIGVSVNRIEKRTQPRTRRFFRFLRDLR